MFTVVPQDINNYLLEQYLDACDRSVCRYVCKEWFLINVSEKDKIFIAAERGYLDILREFVSPSCTRQTVKSICLGASKGSQRKVFLWAKSLCGFCWYVDFHIIAVEHGRYDMLRWLWKQWQSSILDQRYLITTALVKAGELNTLRWIIKRGCSVEYDIRDIAVEAGQIKILDWLNKRELGLYDPASLVVTAGVKEDIPMLDYLWRMHEDDTNSYWNNRAEYDRIILSKITPSPKLITWMKNRSYNI